MCRKSILLIPFTLVLSLVLVSVADAADPDLVGWWAFDETSGTTAYDSSGHGNHGTLQGDPQWVAGWTGGALEFDGDGDYVDVGSVGISGTAPRTLAGWAKASTTDIPNWTTVFGFAPDGSADGIYFDIEVDDAGNYVIYVGGWEGIFGPVDTDWHHFAATYDGEGGSWYLDGQLIDSSSGAIGTVDQVRIGVRLSNTNYFPGTVDDVRIYNKALTLAEIKKLVAGSKAYDPIPPNGALYEDTWVSLGWSLADNAVLHDVYFGDNFNDVNDGTGETFQGNQPTTYFVAGFPGSPCPDGLVPGTTYYWRIDEVEADGTTIHKGDIWSFTVPTKKTYNPNPADGAEFVDLNVVLTWTAGFEAKLHTVYFGDNFDDVNNAAGGLPQGPATYTPGPLKLAKTYYWRVDEFDAIATYKGDVWSFTTEGAVVSLKPSNGAVDVKQTPILSWSPGVYAASHQVYFGADKDAVKNADTVSPEYKGTRELGSESYEPGKLEWDATYYWRIDEVNNVNPDSPWVGPVWSFTTADFLIVDDFEDYDAGDNQIWYTWKDGLGYGTPGTQPYFAGNGTGSAVGHETGWSSMELTIVHGGRQSMPLYYNNNIQGSAKYSEIEKMLTYPRDWTEKGVSTLTIWFRGNSDNVAETLYVALNGSAVVTHDNPDAAKIATWTEWTIDLQAFADQGVNLINVNTIAIGLGNRNNPQAGGSGTMYFDDIRIYPPSPEPEAP
ncbi:MAG: LamG domain-containing protein [Phycisphaerae bacterium]